MASSSSVVPLTPRASIRAGSLVVDSDDLGTPKEGAGAVERMAEACRVLIESIGEDVSRPGLEKTPMRMARALLAITSGYSLDPKQIVADALFECDNDEMVAVRNISFSSMCEHHVLPFYGTVNIAYIPQGRVIGLSKLARLTECFAKRLQIQEQLTNQIAEAVLTTCNARGVAVTIDAAHMCMVMRGVEKPGSVTSTATFLGAFKGTGDVAAALRSEFFARCPPAVVR